MRFPHLAAIILLLIVVCWFVAPPAAAQGFTCDIEPWDQTPDSGFGAGPGEIRGFATVPQNIPPECISNGVSWVNGVIVNATRTAGSTTMPINNVEVRVVPVNDPPSVDVWATGPGGDVPNVPVFPAYVRQPFPVEIGIYAWDPDGNLVVDDHLAGVVYANGDQTAGQFIPYSQTGNAVDCYTGELGQPIDEPCSNGDPLMRGMGIGLEIAAGHASFEDIGGTSVFVRTNNPLEDGSRELDVHVRESETLFPIKIEVVDAVDGPTICTFPDVPPEGVRVCPLTETQAQHWEDGGLSIKLTILNDSDEEPIVPADHYIFADGFEKGDTSTWPVVLP